MGLTDLIHKSGPDFTLAPEFQAKAKSVQESCTTSSSSRLDVMPYLHTFRFDGSPATNRFAASSQAEEGVNVTVSMPKIQYNYRGGKPGIDDRYLTILLVVDYDQEEVDDVFLQADWRHYPFSDGSGGKDPVHQDAVFRVGKRSQTNRFKIDDYTDYQLIKFGFAPGTVRYESAVKDASCASSPVYSAMPASKSSLITKIFSHRATRPVVIEATVVCSVDPCMLSMRVGIKLAESSTGGIASSTSLSPAASTARILLSDPTTPLIFNGNDADYTKQGVDVRYDESWVPRPH